MPGLNQAGPMGQGPMTGRRMGRCTNFGANLSTQNPVVEENRNENQTGNFPGRGFGMGWRQGGRGRGMGWQNRFRGGW
jgi:hypothetical protein